MKPENTLDNGGRLATYLSLGVGAGLLGSYTVSAQIVHNTTHVPVSGGPGHTLSWNPENGKTESSTSGLPTTVGTPFGAMRFAGDHYIYNQDASGMQFVVTGGTTLAKLGEGDTIGPSSNWMGGFTYLDRPGWTTADSGWATGTDGTTGYIGFRFDQSDGQVYGWAKFTYNAASANLVLQDFAYRDALNMPIAAGDIGVVPEPANAGLLFAMGAAGIAAARRLRKKPAV